MATEQGEQKKKMGDVKTDFNSDLGKNRILFSATLLITMERVKHLR